MNKDDLIRVIETETAELARGVDAAKAAATILWAASSLLDQLDPFGDTSARTVARNGQLLGRYTGRGDA